MCCFFPEWIKDIDINFKQCFKEWLWLLAIVQQQTCMTNHQSRQCRKQLTTWSLGNQHMVATTAQPSTKRCSFNVKKHYCDDDYAIVQQRLCVLKVILRHGMRNQFSSFPLLHSNSQLANLLSSPAKNASWTSTPIRFTVFGRVNQGFSDTREDAAERSLCTAACPWETDSATSLSTPSDVKHFQHSLVFIWRTLTLAIHHKGSKKLRLSRMMCIASLLKAVKKVIHFALSDRA